MRQKLANEMIFEIYERNVRRGEVNSDEEQETMSTDFILYMHTSRLSVVSTRSVI